MKKALLIEFNLSTGKRAGDVSPRDRNLPCHDWQDLDSVPAREIRVIEDNRAISQYEGIAGITILNGETEINQAIINITPGRYHIENETIFLEHLRQRNIDLDSYKAQKPQVVLQSLFEKGISGIRKTKRRLL